MRKEAELRLGRPGQIALISEPPVVTYVGQAVASPILARGLYFEH